MPRASYAVTRIVKGAHMRIRAVHIGPLLYNMYIHAILEERRARSN